MDTRNIPVRQMAMLPTLVERSCHRPASNDRRAGPFRTDMVCLVRAARRQTLRRREVALATTAIALRGDGRCGGRSPQADDPTSRAAARPAMLMLILAGHQRNGGAA